MGHLIDLPKSRVAVDVDKGFEPEYITVRGKAKILKDLQTKANKAGRVLLASDNDREGEAISYHLKNALLKKNPNLDIGRIVFNEITPDAIRRAVETPSDIDTLKVNAQKARRVLDRLVGYNLSPILWKKVKNGLSAGRVQSVALRLICEREKEVESFIPEEYWTIDASLKMGKAGFSAAIVRYGEGRLCIPNETDAERIVGMLNGSQFVVASVRETGKTIRPRPPFTTSTMQQTGANRLGFTSRKTMQIAQQLYEGVAVGETRVGLITYMRTDSTRISNQAIDEVRRFLQSNYADELPEKPNLYAIGKGRGRRFALARPLRPRRCSRPEPIVSVLPREKPCRLRNNSTRALPWGKLESVSSPTCEPTRPEYRIRQLTRCADSFSRTMRTSCLRNRTSTRSAKVSKTLTRPSGPPIRSIHPLR